MANIGEKAISISAGNLRSGISYLITTVHFYKKRSVARQETNFYCLSHCWSFATLFLWDPYFSTISQWLFSGMKMFPKTYLVLSKFKYLSLEKEKFSDRTMPPFNKHGNISSFHQKSVGNRAFIKTQLPF